MSGQRARSDERGGLRFEVVGGASEERGAIR